MSPCWETEKISPGIALPSRAGLKPKQGHNLSHSCTGPQKSPNPFSGEQEPLSKRGCALPAEEPGRPCLTAAGNITTRQHPAEGPSGTTPANRSLFPSKAPAAAPSAPRPADIPRRGPQRRPPVAAGPGSRAADCRQASAPCDRENRPPQK